MKTTTPSIQTSIRRPASDGSSFTVVVLALGSFALALSPIAQAVTPAPDGGYPGGNTAEGHNALLRLTTGVYNTAVGLFSLESNATGNFNTATGAGALFATTADENTATGAGTLFSNTEGEANTAHGGFALFNNTEGSDNTADGFEALFTNRTGQNNTATGAQALFFNDGDPTNNEGSENSAFGNNALFSNTTGYANSAFGAGALGSNNSGSFNTANGFLALGDAFASPGGTLQTGSSNTAIGALALGNLTTGNGNIALGIAAGSAVTTSSNVICIGDIAGQNIDNSCFINNIFNTTLTLGSAVFINSDGRLGLLTSSQRFKEEIKPMERASEVLYALTPVAFRYKKGIDPQGVPQFGLIAEQVEKVNPDLIVRDKEGKPYSVRYDQVNAMLLNEFLKEHSKVQQLEATVAQQHNDFETTITELKKEMKRVAARFEEQDARIQKISTRVELSEAETGLVAQK
jgi:Chaperone of endosialidase